MLSKYCRSCEDVIEAYQDLWKRGTSNNLLYHPEYEGGIKEAERVILDILDETFEGEPYELYFGDSYYDNDGCLVFISPCRTYEYYTDFFGSVHVRKRG